MMANKPLKTIKFPGLSDTYTVPQIDNTLEVTGAAADAKKTGDEITNLKDDLIKSLSIKTELNGTLVSGKLRHISGVDTASSDFRYAIFTDSQIFSVNESLLVTGVSYYSEWPLVLFYDNNNGLISYYGYGSGIINYDEIIVSIPEGTATVIVNGNSTHSPKLCTISPIMDSVVIYDISQSKSEEEKAQARANIGAEKAGNGLSDELKQALIDFFEEIVLFGPSGKAKSDVLKEILSVDSETWDLLTNDDVFSTVGYKNPDFTNGVFSPTDGSEEMFSAMVFRPYIKEIEATLRKHNDLIFDTSYVYKMIDGENFEIINHLGQRYKITKSSDDSKYTITQTINDTIDDKDSLITEKTKAVLDENKHLKIYNSNGVLLRDIQNSNILGLWSATNSTRTSGYIESLTISRLTRSYRLLKNDDILFSYGFSGLNVVAGNVTYNSVNTFSAIILKSDFKFFDGNFSVRYSADSLIHIWYVYYSNEDGSTIYTTDGSTLMVFTLNSQTSLYEYNQQTAPGTVTITGGGSYSSRITAWLENNILKVICGSRLITITNANTFGIWCSASNACPLQQLEGRIFE